MSDQPILSPIQPRTNILKSLPPYLKDPKNYKKVQKFILESLAGTHSHGEVIEWAACPGCQRRFNERRHVLWDLGFRSIPQYMLWQRVHQTIISARRDRLKKYNDQDGTSI